MRIPSLLSAVALSLLAFVPAQARAQSSEPPLDYSRTIQQSDMVFVPYTGMNRGPVFYTSYEQAPTAVSTVSSMRKVIVNLMPTAHRNNASAYNSFVSRNGITDAKVLAVPAYGSCQPTAEINSMLGGMPSGYKPKILGGNYPFICSLSLFFWPEDEVRVMNVVNARPVIVLRASVPLCQPNSPSLKPANIHPQLVSAGALSTTSSGVTGNNWSVLYTSAQLASMSPELFVTPDPRQGWELYMKAFTVDSATQTATMSTTTSNQPIPTCTPAPLALQFG